VYSAIEVVLDLSRTVLAADSCKVEHVELAALRNTAGAEGRVDLGQSDRGARGKGEDGGGELHDDCGLRNWLTEDCDGGCGIGVVGSGMMGN
jgi:hypothetical protein